MAEMPDASKPSRYRMATLALYPILAIYAFAGLAHWKWHLALGFFLLANALGAWGAFFVSKQTSERDARRLQNISWAVEGLCFVAAIAAVIVVLVKGRG
jgi:hypothetical protein